MAVSALNFKPYDHGAMRGFFDLRYHGLVIKGCRLMDGKNGLWIAFPQKEAVQDGERRYFDQVYLTSPEAEHVRKMAIADLQAQGRLARPAGAPNDDYRASGGEAQGGYSPNADVEEDIPF